MRKASVWIALGFCVAAMAASAQTARKPGLWEVNSKMTWQVSPIPAGVPMPGGVSPSTPASHITQVCLTQEMINKYGAPVPQSRAECRAENVKKTATGMTAEWVCTGRMTGKGTLEASWNDDTHAQSKIHFMGSIEMGKGAEPIEWTNESSAEFKGADCGDVKPATAPKSATGEKVPGQ